MADLIEGPVINFPLQEPKRHFRFDDNGITDEIVVGRRRSTYFIPIAKPKLKSVQKTLDLGVQIPREPLLSALEGSRRSLDAAEDGTTLLTEEARLTKKLFKLAVNAVDYGDFVGARRNREATGCGAQTEVSPHGIPELKRTLIRIKRCGLVAVCGVI